MPSLHQQQPGLAACSSALEHALDTAEACRAAFQHYDWLHLVALLHGLGGLMADHRWVRESCETRILGRC